MFYIYGSKTKVTMYKIFISYQQFSFSIDIQKDKF